MRQLSVLSNFDVVKSEVDCDMKIFTRSVCVGFFSCVGRFFMRLYRDSGPSALRADGRLVKKAVLFHNASVIPAFKIHII
jgi:hypothetical protein